MIDMRNMWEGLSWLGGTWGTVGVVSVLVVLVLLFSPSNTRLGSPTAWGLKISSRFRTVLATLLGFTGVLATTFMFKLILGVARPTQDVGTWGLAYVSGHSSTSAYLWWLASWFTLLRGLKSKPLLVLSMLTATVPFLIAWSRVELEAHTIIDVVAGLVLGGLWVVGVGVKLAKIRAIISPTSVG